MNMQLLSRKRERLLVMYFTTWGFMEVTDRKVNRGAGYGLEVPCIYRLFGPKAYTDRMKDRKSSSYQSLLLLQ